MSNRLETSQRNVRRHHHGCSRVRTSSQRTPPFLYAHRPERMGCSTSSQTSAVDTTRPSTKPEESNGASTTGVASENGKVAEDSETIPDQTPAEGSDAKPDGEPATAATSADSTSANPPAGEESQPSVASPPADAPAAAAAPAPAPADAPAAAPAPADAPAADSPAETAASSSEAAAAPAPPEQEATATDSGPKAEEAPAPSE